MGRERNQVLDAGDVLSLLRQCGVDLVLSGHRHVPYVWPIAGMLLVHSGTVSTLRTRGFPHRPTT
jgi:3',5'-cyclic-AMP phosphodiesterase